MVDKCTKISNCAGFLIIISGVLFVVLYLGYEGSSFGTRTVTFLDRERVQCYFKEMLLHYTISLESFFSTEEGQELRLRGLAVLPKLAITCQPLADVSKAKIQINKIALISLANETECPLKDLLVHAQNAGYSVVILFYDSWPFRFITNETKHQDKVLIPVLCVRPLYCDPPKNIRTMNIRNFQNFLAEADRTKIEISVVRNNILSYTKQYLARLYCWFLLGPVITLEWLRRRKKLCCMSGGQQAEGGRVPEETSGQSATLNTADDREETQRNYNQGTEYEETRGETLPLLIVLNDPSTNSVTRRGHTRPEAIRRVSTNLGKIFGNLAVGFYYVFLVVVALPVGISSGGLSFFRFDENEIHRPVSFLASWDPSAAEVLPFLWSPIQTLCFFLYSRFVCKSTWTVPNNFSKLIRSDWFSSNVYLFILGIVVPLCYVSSFFAIYNMVCTICNVLFVLILNKHKFVTRYVFYISVCMICAYIESDLVALIYFVMNSKGSLTNLKLTALRTAAIVLTLTLSFSTSTHIIRKLTKPQESLFEALSEK